MPSHPPCGSRFAQRVPSNLGSARGTVFPTRWWFWVEGTAAEHRHHARHPGLRAVHVVLFAHCGDLAAFGCRNAHLFAARQDYKCGSSLEPHVVGSSVDRAWHRIIGEAVRTRAALEDVCRHVRLIVQRLFFVFLTKAAVLAFTCPEKTVWWKDGRCFEGI